jgi:hypothetical protein
MRSFGCLGLRVGDRPRGPVDGPPIDPSQPPAQQPEGDDRGHEDGGGQEEVELEVGHLASSIRRLACLGQLLAAGLLAAPAAAATPLAYRVDAEAEGRFVRGRFVAEAAVAADERHLDLWLYPERLSEPPPALGERTGRWIFPGEVDLGGLILREVRVEGRAVAPTSLAAGTSGVVGDVLRVPLRPGGARRVTVEARFVLELPQRFGRLGRVGDRTSLAAPWYPLLLDDDGSPFAPAAHRVRFPGARLAGLSRDRVALRARYVPAWVGPAYPTRRRVLGVPVDFVRRAPPYRPPPATRSGDDGLVDVVEVDVAGLLFETIGEVLEGAQAFGVPLPPHLVVEEVPSRTELTGTAPGVVLVSDRLFQVFPLDEVRAFHHRALRRALFRRLVEAAGPADRPAEREWADDLRAVAILDADAARGRGQGPAPQELLRAFAFHPAVDQLLYAPQIAFEDAYFATLVERDPYRDDPARALRGWPRGRRLLERLRDAVDDEDVPALVGALTDGATPVRATLARFAPDLALGDLLDPPRVNYVLGERRSEPIEGGFRHVVEVRRDGDTRAEPVEVVVVDGDGERCVAVWDGPGPRGEASCQTGARWADVTLDPRRRRPQSPELADGHPRADDTTSLPFRPPILNGFVLNVFVTEGDFTGLLDFAVRRRFDLEHTLGVRLQRTRAFTGGRLRYAQGVGPKVHTNRRLASIQVGVGLDRLRGDFGDEGRGGWRTQLSVGAALNTVAFTLDPREGFWLAGSLSGGLTVRDPDQGDPEAERIGLTLRGQFRGGTAISFGLWNTLALIVGGGLTAGEALPSEVQGLGGAARLRGFESDEILGRGVLYAIAEHRYTLLRDLSLSVAHLVWLREVQVALFASTGVAFDTSGGTVGAADAGVGLRFHFEYGGVQPGVLSLDLGVPLTRQDDRIVVDGEVLGRRNPVGFYLAFDQFF